MTNSKSSHSPEENHKSTIRRTPFLEKINTKTKIPLTVRLRASLQAARIVYAKLNQAEFSGKLQRFAVQRAESFESSVGLTIEAGFRLLPSKTDLLDFPIENYPVKRAEQISKGVFEIEHHDGTRFLDWEGSNKHLAGYWLFKDKVPKGITARNFFAASAVKRSYTHGTSRVAGDQTFPKEGGVVVEVEAYVGYKALAYAKKVGPSGRVIAIEASRENFQLLERNVALNCLQGVITPVHAAVAESNSTGPLYGDSRMNNSIRPSEEKRSLPKKSEVAFRRLDSILEECQISQIDFVNIQVNGSEVEALIGLGRFWGSTKSISIISRAKQNGVPTIRAAIAFAEESGATIRTYQEAEDLFSVCFEPCPMPEITSPESDR
jgi:FkbM family methyltransferase